MRILFVIIAVFSLSYNLSAGNYVAEIKSGSRGYSKMELAVDSVIKKTKKKARMLANVSNDLIEIIEITPSSDFLPPAPKKLSFADALLATNAQEKGKENFISGEHSSISKAENNMAAKPVSRTKTIASLSEKSHRNLRLQLTKGHRFLDNIARQISRELSIIHISAGSVSVALANVKGRDMLLVSIMEKQVTEDMVLAAVNNLVHYSENYFERNNYQFVMVGAKARYIESRQLIKRGDLSDANQKALFKARSEIDKLRLAAMLRDPNPDAISARIKEIFSNDITDTVRLIVNNGYHSEINLINYLLAENLSLDVVINESQQTIPYQYVGGSLLCCGNCAGVIKGFGRIKGINYSASPSNLAFFARGEYAIRYPGYKFPQWALECNNHNLETMRARFKRMPFIDDVHKSIVINTQLSELSDSDEE